MNKYLFKSIKAVSFAIVGGVVAPSVLHGEEIKSPNIIMLLADDLGWGDVGFTGNQVVKTPALDALSQSGVEFENFRTVSPLSSPSRASILTGRNPFRMGIYAAHTGAVKGGEVTIAEVCQDNGYATGFFGKWHLGWVESAYDGERGYYSPPEHHGFEEVFATRSAVPTWNPARTPQGWNQWGNKEGGSWNSSRYVHNGTPATDNLEGDDSRVIMDRVIPFIERSVKEGKPFISCIWFHTPHEPVVAGPEYLAMYENLGVESEAQRHYYGAITAMDDQIARLVEYLKEIGEYENTIITFASDNGPADGPTKSGVASAGDFKGHKHQVYDGGVRVPSFMVYPQEIVAGVKVKTQVITCDYLPTLIDLAGLTFEPYKAYLSDGINVVPTFKDTNMKREESFFIGWKRIYKGIYGRAVIDGDYKYLYGETSQEPELYNIAEDPNETTNIIGRNRKVAAKMEQMIKNMEVSFINSDQGGDYKSY